MRAVEFETFGEPGDVLKVVSRESPRPAPGHVVVRLRARAINPSDLFTVRGKYGVLPQLPATPGLEGVGEVTQVGSQVTGLSLGDRVVTLGPIVTGTPGTWAEEMSGEAASWVKVPASVPDEVAAQFLINPVTAWAMIHDIVALPPGSWVMQTGAASAVGRAVIAFARAAGHKTLNVVHRVERVAELNALGADVTLCTEEDDVLARVREVTEGKGVPLALESVGGRSLNDCIQSLSVGGTVVLYGLVGALKSNVELSPLLFGANAVRGFWLTRYLRALTVERRQEVATKVMNLLSERRLVPGVEATYDLAQVGDACRHAEAEGRRGKVLLVG